MKRLVALPLATALLLALAAHGAVAGGSVQHDSLDLAGISITCPAADYTIVAGWADVVYRFAPKPNGDLMLVESDTFHEVLAEDGVGGQYAIRGHSYNNALWPAGSDPEADLPRTATFTETLEIIGVGSGGTVASVSLMHHLTFTGTRLSLHEFDFGECSEPTTED